MNGGGVDMGGAGVAPGQDFPSLGNYSLTPAEIFAAAHADPRANLIQINHMHSYFDTRRPRHRHRRGGTPPQSHTPPRPRAGSTRR